MKRNNLLALIGCVVLNMVASAQNKYDGSKAGTSHYITSLTAKGVTRVVNPAFNKNVSDLCQRLVQSLPMLSQPKGFDLQVFSQFVWSDNYMPLDCEYGIPASVNLDFQLFLKNGDKWVNEPPTFKFFINKIGSGGDAFFRQGMSDKSYPEQKAAIEKARRVLENMFVIYPHKVSLVNGVDLYDNPEDGGRWKFAVVYNPARPPYWVPLTVREITTALLAYHSLFNKSELEQMAIDELKNEIDEMADEMDKPAYFDPSEHMLTTINGKEVGYPVMRFNPDYWNRKLPTSDIQFMVFRTDDITNEKQRDDTQQFGYPHYDKLLFDQLDWQKIVSWIVK